MKRQKISFASPMTPLQSIRKFCLTCVGSPSEVHRCGGDKCLNGGSNSAGECLFYRHREGKHRPSVKLIRQMCLWCQGERRSLVEGCTEECPLHPYRLGRNPNMVGKKISSESLKNLRKTT